MSLVKQSEQQTTKLVLEAEREAQMASAIMRLVIVLLVATIFFLAEGASLPVGDVVLAYLGCYTLISAGSAVCAIRTLFKPWFALLFAALDGLTLAFLIGFSLVATDAPMTFFGATPSFLFVFSFLVLATMRYNIAPILILYVSFLVTWLTFEYFVDAYASQLTTNQFAGPNSEVLFSDSANFVRWSFLSICVGVCVLAVWRRKATLHTGISEVVKTTQLSRFLPDKIAESIANGNVELLNLGRTQKASVLFVDISGFTGLSENMDPEDIGRLLSEFRSLVGIEAERFNGLIDKFIGDAVMINFGIPAASQEDAANSVKCALGILTSLQDWVFIDSDHKKHQIRVSMGIHQGEVFAGTIGARDRLEFTVLGDTVNVAARLQTIAKDTSNGLVVSQAVIDDCFGKLSAMKDWKALPDSNIRGRQGSILLFSPDY